MKLQRLHWAGAHVETGKTRLLIDPVYRSPDYNFFGEPKHSFSSLSDLENIDVILITHLHSDHFDPELIINRFGSDTLVLVPEGCEADVKARGLNNVLELSIHDTYRINNTTITATYSLDGLGDNQVSWIISEENKTIIHCGDTLWHGYWTKIQKKYGPFDAALLPINGAIVNEPGETHSKQPICMTPEQAVSAAKVLNANLLIPIHYDSFHNPPIYLETKNLSERLAKAASQEAVLIKMLQPQDLIEL